jgi:hypothetical protein
LRNQILSPTEREIEDQIREARLYKLGQAAFLLVETIAAAVLAAIYFNAPRVLAVMIGVVIALLLGAAAAAMVTRWVAPGGRRSAFEAVGPNHEGPACAGQAERQRAFQVQTPATRFGACNGGTPKASGRGFAHRIGVVKL